MGDTLMSTINVDTINVDTIKNAAGTREFFPCTAWVNFNGSGTVAIRDSGNVSSITDNGVGDYDVNFAQLMDNVNYSWGGGVKYTTTESVGLLSMGSTDTKTTSALQIRSRNSTIVAAIDSTDVNVQVFGGIS